jgi:hypothetical protein
MKQTWVYLENIVLFSFSLSRLLFAQRIFRFYVKAEVTFPPNYLCIVFWPEVFLCQKEESFSDSSAEADTSSSYDITVSGKVRKGQMSS